MHVTAASTGPRQANQRHNPVAECFSVQSFRQWHLASPSSFLSAPASQRANPSLTANSGHHPDSGIPLTPALVLQHANKYPHKPCTRRDPAPNPSFQTQLCQNTTLVVLLLLVTI